MAKNNVAVSVWETGTYIGRVNGKNRCELTDLIAAEKSGAGGVAESVNELSERN